MREGVSISGKAVIAKITNKPSLPLRGKGDRVSGG